MSEKAASDIDPRLVNFQGIYTMISAIEEVTKLGVPVYIAAGNSGPDYLNLFSLAKGAITVGAFDGDNEDSERIYLSADNSLVNGKGRGVFYTSPVLRKDGSLSGYSIMDNNRVVFKKSEISKDIPVVDKFVGKPLKEVLAQEEDYPAMHALQNMWTDMKPVKKYNDRISKLDGLLFDIDKLVETKSLSKEEATFLNRHGDYVDSGMNHAFRVDKDGKIISDPENNGRKALMSTIGTSFASPYRLAQNEKKKFAGDNDLC
ncbi:MAG: hypothetical protein A2287_00340 [Candidatus Melainabacteria bacterium RIFOXYA12_FULL_32_12]|nr:MAG: hypothetical protein A2255_07310 [Candidatus Melainabacteria bacterium RIFOXYA2_FULL_32_9]OGI31392.1 MAG: hypothetical protein A2287_00340 [Candidatus Melainabacteria bacterium RIFOXYA12_FULL_32_12]